MFPSLLSHELAAARQDDLRRSAALAGARRRHDPKLSALLAAAVDRAIAAVPRPRLRPAPRACVTC